MALACLEKSCICNRGEVIRSFMGVSEVAVISVIQSQSVTATSMAERTHARAPGVRIS